MSIFLVDQLMNIAASGAFLRVPENICALLKELEACLEITDADDGTSASAASASSRFDSGANVRHYRKNDRERGEKDASFRKHAPNRYDVDALTKESLKHDSSKHRRQDGSKKYGGESSAAVDPEDWSSMRSFKATKIDSKTGVEKTINDIRVALNKMSSANYEKQREVVLNLVSSTDADFLDNANIRRVSKAIFDIASTNKFYSEIYATLYKELVKRHSVFRELLDEFVAGFTVMDSAPVYVDPDKDYDGYCVYSKACDVRKSTSTFLVNCAKQGIIEPDQIVRILCSFLAFVETSINEEGKGKVVEEVIENVFIIATLCKAELQKTSQWKTDILEPIQILASRKINGQLSFSSRAAFKCMDILDNISS